LAVGQNDSYEDFPRERLRKANPNAPRTIQSHASVYNRNPDFSGAVIFKNESSRLMKRTLSRLSGMASDRLSGHPTWLTAFVSYLASVTAANLVWEVAHLPLYTIWWVDHPGAIAYAVVHCTIGDLLIASMSLGSAAILLGRPSWPDERFWPVAIMAIATGVAYATFSEWLNTEIRHTWTYSNLMPTLPWIGTGLSPLAQWIATPLVAFWWLQRRVLHHLKRQEIDR
jgi:hypothetical protein